MILVWAWAVLTIFLFGFAAQANPFALFFRPKPPRYDYRFDFNSRSAISHEAPNRPHQTSHTAMDSTILFDKGANGFQAVRLSGERVALHGGRLQVGKDEKASVTGPLFDHSIGFSTKRVWSKKTMAFGAVSYGSAGDKPFQSARDTVVSVTGGYGFRPKATSQWFALFNYSNNRAFLNHVPLPSVGYLYKPSKNFNALIGLPFLSFTWVSWPAYFANVLVSPSKVQGTGSVSLLGPYQAYLKVKYGGESYMHENRRVDENRLYLVSQDVQLGLQGPFTRSVLAKLALGYDFNRSLFEGDGIFDPIGPRSPLSDHWYLRVNFSFRL